MKIDLIVSFDNKINEEDFFGKIVDMSLLENSKNLLLNVPMTPSITKTRKRRRGVEKTILTGNILIDYVSPLYQGNFNVLTGPSNMGEKQILNSTAVNFLNNDSEDNFLIYLTHSKKEANKLFEIIKEQNNLNSQNFVIFNLSENPCDTEFYYLPRIALQFMKYLVEKKKEKKRNILLCYDDIITNILLEKNIFQTAGCYVSPSNIFAEIREQCGNFQNYSISSVLIAEKNKTNLEFEENNEKMLKNIYSFTDKIVKFEPNIKMMKKYIPNLYLDFSGLTNININSAYITTHNMEFKDIMNLIFQSHIQYEETKKLNIQVDPWDNYLYYDSKFLLDFIFNNNYKPQGILSNRENVNTNISYENVLEKFLQLKFLLFIYHNDLMANFKIDGKTVSIKLLESIMHTTENDKDNFIFGFIKNVLLNKNEPTDEEIEKFETKLEMLFDLFIQDLKNRNQFSEVKEDYFKV